MYFIEVVYSIVLRIVSVYNRGGLFILRRMKSIWVVMVGFRLCGFRVIGMCGYRSGVCFVCVEMDCFG